MFSRNSCPESPSDAYAQVCVHVVLCMWSGCTAQLFPVRCVLSANLLSLMCFPVNSHSQNAQPSLPVGLATTRLLLGAGGGVSDLSTGGGVEGGVVTSGTGDSGSLSRLFPASLRNCSSL